MFYRVAIRQDTSTTWQWKSTTISSLNALFQFLRRYDKLPQDRLRVFSSRCIEEMNEQLACENDGSGSSSVTAKQFREAHMMGAQSVTTTTAAASSDQSSNGSYPARESFHASRPMAASRGDFWNLMTLANS